MIYTVSSQDAGINWDATDEERIVQNVLNILRTRKREIPFMPDVGLQIENIDSLIRNIQRNIQDDVIELIGKYERRVEVLSVTVDTVTENGDIEIKVVLEV